MRNKLALGIMSLLITSVASAYVVTTGSTTGTYYKVGANLTGLVPGGEVVASKGSVENLERLMAEEADIGLVQMDALAWFMGKHPEAKQKLEVMGSLYHECVYIAVNKEGKVQDEDDLQHDGVTIAVGKQGSGTAVTWDYMRKLEPGYKKAAVVFTGGSRALGKLTLSKKGGDSAVDAVLWVTRPTVNNKMLRTVLANPTLDVIQVNDKDLNDTYKPLGRPVYEFQKIPTKDGVLFNGSIKTPCVEALLVARSTAEEEVLDKVADIVLNYKASLLK